MTAIASKVTKPSTPLTTPNGAKCYNYNWKPGTTIYVGNMPYKLEHTYIDGGVLLSNGDWYPAVIRDNKNRLIAVDTKLPK